MVPDISIAVVPANCTASGSFRTTGAEMIWVAAELATRVGPPVLVSNVSVLAGPELATV